MREKLKRFFRPEVLLLVGVLLVICGAKFSLIRGMGSDLPYWDQWDSEGDLLFASDGRGTLTVQKFFLPHTEHRIVFTKLLAYTLEKINGQWDARLEMTVNVGLHLAAIFVLLFTLFKIGSRPVWIAAAISALIVFGLPLDWENTLGGFQSVFYFLCFFSTAHLAGTLVCPERSKCWWAAQVAGACALFSMASGMFSALALLGVFALDLLRERKISHTRTALIGYNVILVLAGLLLRTVVPGHAFLKAHSVNQFFTALVLILSWPSPFVAAGALVFVPLFVFLWCRRRTGLVLPIDRFIVALIAWWLLQIVAVAAVRGGGDPAMSSRYCDLYAVGLIATTVLWMMGFSATGCLRLNGLVFRILFAVWLILLAFGLNWQTRRTNELLLQPLITYNRQRNETVRAYVDHHDRKFFAAAPVAELPYPSAERLASLLDQPSIRAILPVSVRPSLASNSPDQSRGFSRTDKSRILDAPVSYHIWTSLGRSEPNQPASIESGWISPTHFPFLQFFVTESSRNNELWIETQHNRRRIQIPTSSADRWKSVLVSEPIEPFRFVAKSKAGASLSFTQPVEVPLATWVSRQLLKTGLALIILGAVLVLFSLDRIIFSAWASIQQKLAKIDWTSPTAACVGTLFLCSAILFYRRPDVLSHPQFWSEDASIFFVQAHHLGFKSFFIPYAGYFHFFLRVIALACCGMTTEFDPAAYVYVSLIFTLLVAGTVFSSRIHLPYKPLIALSIVLVPHSGEVFLNLTNLQWITALALFLIVLKSEPLEEWRNYTDAAMVFVLGLTGPFAALFLPLYALRWLRYRSLGSTVITASAGVAAVIQALVLLHSPNPTVAHAPHQYSSLSIALYRLTGLMLAGQDYGTAIGVPTAAAVGAVGLGLILFLAYRARAYRWEFALLSIALCTLLVGSVMRTRGLEDVLIAPWMGDRYFFIPKVLVLWLLCLSAVSIKRPAVALAGMILILNWPHFRFLSYIDYHWKETAAQIDAGQTLLISVNPEGTIFWNNPVGFPRFAELSNPMLIFVGFEVAASVAFLFWPREVDDHHRVQSKETVTA